MSELKVSANFKQDFLDASRYFLLTGETDEGIADIKQNTRELLATGGEDAELRKAWITDLANEMRFIDSIGARLKVLPGKDAPDSAS